MIRETGVARSHKTHKCLTCRAESGEAGMAVSKDNHRRPTRAHCGIRTFTHCLSPFGQLHQSTIDWRAYTQQIHPPPTQEAVKSKIKASVGPGFGEGPFLTGGSLLAVTSRGGRGRNCSGLTLIRKLISFMRACSQDLITSPKSHLLMPPPWGMGLQPLSLTET